VYSDLPGVVPVGYGAVPHFFFAVTGRNPQLRRFFDLTIVLGGLVIATPFFLVLPILIKLDSPGPILYRAIRIGKGGHPYTMYKFRSMYVQPLAYATMHTNQDGTDTRLTRVGRWARRYCLDEMPQLFNILKGDMSVFGPRPGMPQQS
jgi:lipopolysaccharide/colanic/teichoic acid biosynthesis glycosyltransferase